LSQPEEMRRRKPKLHRGECTRGHRGGQGVIPSPGTWLAAALLLVVMAAAVGAAFEGARYSRAAERHFTRGITAYDGGDLETARENFRSISDLPANQRSGAALLMLSRTLIRQGGDAPTGAVASAAYHDAIDVSRELLRQAPDSRYSADARLLVGDAYHQLKRFYEAATEYARILEGTAPLAVRAMAAERLAAIVRNRRITTVTHQPDAPPSALDRIRLKLGEDRLRDALLFGEARWYGRLGWGGQSRERFTAYIDSVGTDGMFYSLAKAGLSGQTMAVPATVEAPELVVDIAEPLPVSPSGWAPLAGREDAPRIGVLAPMSGPRWEREIGRDLLAGARMANEEMGEPFDLVVFDTGSEYVDFEGETVPIYQSEASRLVRVVSGTRFLIDEVGVAAIIGPVFSTSCAAAAGLAEAAGVPLIAPLAQQSGLDTLGSHLFQLNPIPEVQGRALAEYATLVLGLKTLAILSPLSDYGYDFEQAFTHTATRNGGLVLHSDWYVPEATTDFHAQFDSLRQKGFRLMPPAGDDSLSLFDSLETALLDTTVSGEWLFEELVRAEGLGVAPSQPDSSERFVDTVDGVVIVAEHFDDAARIAPQLHFNRLQTQMLGNDIWNDAEALAELSRTERDHLRSAIFVSRRQGSETERDFVDRYRLRTHRDDVGYAAAGFDAASLILRGWSSVHGTGADLRQFLADVRQYEGASGRISFTESRRANSEMTLLTIDHNGQVRPLGAADLPSLKPTYVDADLPAESLPDEGDDGPEWELSESPR